MAQQCRTIRCSTKETYRLHSLYSFISSQLQKRCTKHLLSAPCLILLITQFSFFLLSEKLKCRIALSITELSLNLNFLFEDWDIAYDYWYSNNSNCDDSHSLHKTISFLLIKKLILLKIQCLTKPITNLTFLLLRNQLTQSLAQLDHLGSICSLNLKFFLKWRRASHEDLLPNNNLLLT